MKKGNKIKDCENTGLAPNFNCGGKLDKDPLIERNNRILGAFNQRVSEQQPVLVQYFELMNSRDSWSVLVDRCKEKTSTTHLRKAMKGKTSFVNKTVWSAVKEAINEILLERKLIGVEK